MPADSIPQVVRRYLVSGRVQGVFFRASTREQATRLGMSGHAINLPDGRVEVLASGDLEAHRRLLVWLHDGPPLASVSEVTVADCKSPVPEGFTTG